MIEYEDYFIEHGKRYGIDYERKVITDGKKSYTMHYVYFHNVVLCNKTIKGVLKGLRKLIEEKENGKS